jgi:hypothetical protein
VVERSYSVGHGHVPRGGIGKTAFMVLFVHRLDPADQRSGITRELHDRSEGFKSNKSWALTN